MKLAVKGTRMCKGNKLNKLTEKVILISINVKLLKLNNNNKEIKTASLTGTYNAE